MNKIILGWENIFVNFVRYIWIGFLVLVIVMLCAIVNVVKKVFFNCLVRFKMIYFGFVISIVIYYFWELFCFFEGKNCK